MVATDSIHNNQTAAVNHAPRLILVAPEEFQCFPFDWFVNRYKFDYGAGFYAIPELLGLAESKTGFSDC
jgi:hypothetical protein